MKSSNFFFQLTLLCFFPAALFLDIFQLFHVRFFLLSGFLQPFTPAAPQRVSKIPDSPGCLIFLLSFGNLKFQGVCRALQRLDFFPESRRLLAFLKPDIFLFLLFRLLPCRLSLLFLLINSVQLFSAVIPLLGSLLLPDMEFLLFLLFQFQSNLFQLLFQFLSQMLQRQIHPLKLFFRTPAL